MTNAQKVTVKDDIVDILGTVSITKDDLLAVSVAEYELKLINCQKEARSKLNDLKADRNKIRERVDAEINSAINSKIGKQIEATEKAICDLGLQKSIIRIDGITNDIVSGVISFRINIGTDYSRPSVEKKIKVPTSIKLLKKKEVELDDKIEKMTDYIIEVKKALKNIDFQERQARAALAISVMENSTNGRKLLKSQQSIKKLPMPVMPK